MTLTNKQKIYGVLLGVGLASLVVDRLLIGSDIGPDQASADSAQAYVGTMDLPDLTVAAVQPIHDVRNEGPTMGDRVATLARERGVDVSQVRDAFVPHKSWLPESNSAKVVKQSSDLSPEQFRIRHRLMAVVITDEARYVVVDGDMLRVGEFVDGYRLVAVKERSAILKLRGAAVELILPTDQSNQ